MELYLHSPNAPSWSGAQLNHRDNFTFYLYRLCWWSCTTWRWHSDWESNFIMQSPSWKVQSSSNGQGISCLLWNPKLRHRVTNPEPHEFIPHIPTLLL
jgi:hypothetical protein